MIARPTKQLGLNNRLLRKSKKMNRRHFNIVSLAAILAPLPRLSFAQQIAPPIPGYQVAEIEEGRLTSGYGGMATSKTPVDDETLFQAASCSKTVAALAILTLVRDGRINLDQPANKYLERWQITGPNGPTATVAALMSHTAGTTVHGFAGYAPDEEVPDLIDILAGRDPANSDSVQARRRLFRQFRYSGGGTTVLQALIEDVTGTDFATYAATEVLRPVGAPRATFAIKPSAPFAHGSFSDGSPVPGGFRRHPESAAAGLWATASDLARVMHAIINSLRGQNDALLPMALAERMVTPVSADSGLGVFIYPGPIIAHDGRNFGFDSVMAAELETGRVRSAMTNRNGAISGYIEEITSP
jgi:CubicO group peptidase (beta-lactamase class C family)